MSTAPDQGADTHPRALFAALPDACRSWQRFARARVVGTPATLRATSVTTERRASVARHIQGHAGSRLRPGNHFRTPRRSRPHPGNDFRAPRRSRLAPGNYLPAQGKSRLAPGNYLPAQGKSRPAPENYVPAQGKSRPATGNYFPAPGRSRLRDRELLVPFRGGRARRRETTFPRRGSRAPRQGTTFPRRGGRARRQGTTAMSGAGVRGAETTVRPERCRMPRDDPDRHEERPGVGVRSLIWGGTHPTGVRRASEARGPRPHRPAGSVDRASPRSRSGRPPPGA